MGYRFFEVENWLDIGRLTNVINSTDQSCYPISNIIIICFFEKKKSLNYNFDQIWLYRAMLLKNL